ncbi:MAG: protease, partial [bacterium]|nr:protease [bacterium]
MTRTTATVGTGLLAVLSMGCATKAESHLMRMADVHHDQIVFTYEDDLWLVPSVGGDARRITNDPGSEQWAKFSPDGARLAFTAQYDGGTDVYVMDARGGVPRRLTYHPSSDRVLEWFPDGKHVLFRARREYPFRGEMVYQVSVDGGMPQKLPVDRAGLTTISPDGRRIAYNRITREHATWKRYQGGMAQEIWMGSLADGDFRKITDWPGHDNFPMWQGQAIYFTSDRLHETLNLHKYDLASGKVTAQTQYNDYDVKYPSVGPGAIVYQYGEALHLLDLNTGQSRLVPVNIPSDLVRMRPEYVSIAPRRGSFGLSPSGKRVLLEARGEILNLPAEDGEPINLTRTSASREKKAAWSPDGRWVAFISDKTGEEEIYLVDQHGEQPWRQLTKGGLGFRMQPVWSPDSKHLLMADKFLQLNLVDAETGAVLVIDQANFDDAWERWGIQDYVWSPDSKWVAYTKMERSLNDSIFLYSLETGQSHRVTAEATEDWSPSFDPQGRYLYFLSNRTFDPIMGLVDQNHIFLNMARPYLLVLADGEPSPFAPEDSQEEPADDSDEEDDEEEDDGDDATRIDIEDISRRIVAVPGVSASNLFRLEATDKGFCYLKKDDLEFIKYQVITDETGGHVDLYHYDLEEREAENVLEGIANYHPAAGGEKLIYRMGSRYGVVDVGSEATVGDGEVDLSGVRVKVDRIQEFAQLFDEAWRIQRDWFYDPGMHAVDWEAIRAKYRKFVPYCGNRSDLNYLIGEMIAELNIGHTYVRGGDVADDARRVSVGLLGAEFQAEAGADYYRISRIIPGTPGDPGERSPFDEPGCPIKTGHYLIAIDGEPITTADNVYARLLDKADKVVKVTYNERPTGEGAQTYRVRTIGNERAIRYREWVDRNRAYVEKATDGKVGYLHIPNMGQSGLTEFAKAYYPAYYKQGFVIDERYNGGGFTGDMIIDRLERKLWAITQAREGGPMRDPERCFHGHFVVLINEDTGSNGEYFAEAIKLKGLAPIVGMRTWGGAVGIEPHQDLMDGGSVTPPQFAPYGLD